jgi:hypothetical protein
MHIILDYNEYLDIEGLKAGDKVRLNNEITIDNFLSRLELSGAAPEEIQPYLNGEKIDPEANLSHEDELFLDLQ